MKFFTFLAFIVIANLTYAQDDFFDTIEVGEIESQDTEDKAWSIRGHIQQEMKYGIDSPPASLDFERKQEGLSQVRSEVFLEYNFKFNENAALQISGKSELDWLTWENNNQDWSLTHYDTRLKDAYLDFTFANNLWLRLGNQVIAWGESESLSITDVLSKTDLREPGQAELEDIREPVPAVFISKPLNTENSLGKLNLVVTYKAGTDRFARENEDFYPLVSFKALFTAEDFHLVEPEAEWEAAVQYQANTNGGDYAFVLAEINDNRPEPFNILFDTQLNILGVELYQRRQNVIGLSANKVIDAFLVRGELGLYRDKKQENLSSINADREQQKRFMFGVEYNGVNDWLFSLEYNYLESTLIEIPAVKESDTGYTFQSQYTALNEKLTMQLWLIELAEEGGQIARLNFSYKPADNWEGIFSIVNYENDKVGSTLYPFRNNDTINLALKYGF